jgi:hypothetical protein
MKMQRYEDCEVCGERYHNEFIKQYLTHTTVGSGTTEKVIVHCKPNLSSRCTPVQVREEMKKEQSLN